MGDLTPMPDPDALEMGDLTPMPVGLASVAAALLTSLQTFMSYAERAEKHRIAGARYGALGRELEQMKSSGGEYPPEVIAELRRRIDDLALEAPNNPLKIYKQAGGTEIEVVMK
jgi:hypothetical protein